MTPLRIFFAAVAVVFVAGALYHAVGIVIPTATEPSPAWRHGVFIAISLAGAAGFWFRPRFFAYAFGLLVAQQLWSHTEYGLFVWTHEHRVDWASVLVVLGMPLLMALLIFEKRIDRPKA